MVMGRPVEFTDELQQEAWDYIQNYADHDHAVPSVVGLCQVINRSKTTIYQWAARSDNDFKDILEAIKEKQELVTFNKALRNEYNASIAKLLLGKHGYSDKSEQEVKGSLDIHAIEYRIVDETED